MADDSGRLNQVFAETSFLYGANAVFIEMMQEKWAEDPNSVPPEWRAFFDQLLERPGGLVVQREGRREPGRRRARRVGADRAAHGERAGRWPFVGEQGGRHQRRR